MVDDFTPWSTAKPLFQTPLPSYVSGLDQQRIAAYHTYDLLYWNVPGAFRLMQRGSETDPIYIPSGKTIIEASNRYLCREFGWTLNPLGGTPDVQAIARASFRKLFARERFRSKFASLKRNSLIRGDALWHIVADPAQPAGSRISIYELDPSSYMPIRDPNNSERRIGVHIIEPVTVDGKGYIRRQTYRKTDTGAITTALGLYDPAAWDDRDGEEVKLQQVIVKEQALPPAITALPVYHIRNTTATAPFGSSEMRGLERVAAAVNQAISDEELALALDGLGMYATTSGPPVDEDGNEVDWVLGPGRVIELDPASNFERVTGVSSVTAMQDHLKFLVNSMRESSATPDVAVGTVDVQVAQSGIALQLQMLPILSKNGEKEDELLAVHDQMFYDLVHGWFPAYEGMNWDGVEVTPVVGPPLPVDRAAIVAEVTALLSTVPPLISAAYARQLLAEKLGYEFPEEMGADVVMEAAAMNEARGFGDPFRQRLEEELGTPVDAPAPSGGAGSPASPPASGVVAPSLA